MPIDRRSRWFFPLTLAVLAGAAPAQNIDCAMASKESIDAADESALRKYVTERVSALKSEDVAASEKARDELLQPLRCKDVSVDFRVKMSRLIAPDLARLISESQVHVALNAARLSGEIGTQQAVEVAKSGLSDKRSPVRVMSALALRDALRAATAPGNTAAIRRTEIDTILAAIAQQIETETDVNVTEYLVIALDSTQGDPGIHAQAMRRLAASLAVSAKALRARGTEEDAVRWTQVLIRGTEGVWRPMAVGEGATIDREYRVAAALLSGQALVYARERLALDAPSEGSPEATGLKTLVNTSERNILLVDAAIKNAPIQKQTLVEKFDEAVRNSSPDAFAEEASKWVGSSGALLKSPYNAKASDFASAAG